MILAEMRKFHNLNCLPDSNQNQNPNLGIWGRYDTLWCKRGLNLIMQLS